MGDITRGTVYILGAGASFGDVLESIPGGESGNCEVVNPPLATGFFSAELLTKLGGSASAFEGDLKNVINYVRLHWGIEDDFGNGRWTNLSLEQVLSHVDLEADFITHESANWIVRLNVRNELISHIQRTLGLCTQGNSAKFARILASSLKRDDSIISLNWDLLVDSELLSLDAPQVSNFLGCLETYPPGDPQPDYLWQQGLFLKPHGSLNWSRCSNPACPMYRSFVFRKEVQGCLSIAASPQWFLCANCAEKALPLIVPPVVRKRIAEDNVIRQIWGLARTKLQFAKKLVVVGFSLPPSDFYAEWLLRSSTTHLGKKTIFIVNPSNDPQDQNHSAFSKRMCEVFPRGFNSEYRYFSEVEQVIQAGII